jgi:integrase
VLAATVDAYIAVRRAAGFTFRSEARQLASFAAFSEARTESHVRVFLAIEWAAVARSVSQRARRLGHVIRLARYLRAEDRDHEVPPAVFGGEKRSRPSPYIISPEQIGQLVLAASRSGYRTLRRHTYSTLFALLASTGLRASDAVHLRLDDITPDGLVIRRSKAARAASSRCTTPPEPDSSDICSAAVRMHRPRLTSSSRCGGNRSCSTISKSRFAPRPAPLACGLAAGATDAALASPHVCREGATGLAGRARRHHPAHVAAVHVSRARQGRRHLLVPGSRAGADDGHRRSV